MTPKNLALGAWAAVGIAFTLFVVFGWLGSEGTMIYLGFGMIFLMMLALGATIASLLSKARDATRPPEQPEGKVPPRRGWE
jgi:hypothetical protein